MTNVVLWDGEDLAGEWKVTVVLDGDHSTFGFMISPSRSIIIRCLTAAIDIGHDGILLSNGYEWLIVKPDMLTG